jgi:aspartate carbamoyltransferase regulatory subunit
MLYLREKLSSGKKSEILLQEFCRRCGFEETPEKPDTANNIVVYERVLKGETLPPEVDSNLFLDPAIPTTKEIRCPNAECPSNRMSDSVEVSARFIVIDPSMIKIMYRCVHCETIWKNRN